MVGDTGTEADNKRQRGPLARKACGASPASTARARRACVRAQPVVQARAGEGFVCVRGAT